MKRIISLILCLALLAALTACGSEDTEHTPTGDALVMEWEDPDALKETEPEDPQEFSLAYYPERSMNPLTCNDFTNRALFSLIYQGLFSTNSQYEAVPILCSQYRISPSGQVWTFYLDSSATFSDGTPVTVEDVMATYTAAKASDYYKGRFYHINRLELTEDGGIAFYLNTPYQDLPILLDIPIVKATEVEAEHPLGTGPYAYRPGITGANLSRITKWWCDTKIPVTAETIPLVKATTPAQIRDEFEFNDVGLVCADPGTASYADFRGDFELWDCDNGVMLYLGCNVSYSDIFSDDRVRAALTYAIDRSQIVNDIYRGLALPSTLATSPRSPFYLKALADRYSYDPMRLIEALNSYGVVTERAKLLVNSDDSMRLRTARAIADMLTECGLPTDTEEVETNIFYRRLAQGEYDLYLGQTRLSPNMDLSCFFAPYASLSRGGISNDEIYILCKDALADRGNYYNMLKAVADDGRICPILFSGNSIYATRGLMSDLAPSRDNVFFYTIGKTMETCQLPTIYD